MRTTVIDENREIVEKIAKEELLWHIIMNVTNDGKEAKDPSSLRDLEQDLLLSFMFDPKLAELDKENRLQFYMSRCVVNNIKSSSSKYYRQYLKHRLQSNEFNDGYKSKPIDYGDERNGQS